MTFNSSAFFNNIYCTLYHTLVSILFYFTLYCNTLTPLQTDCQSWESLRYSATRLLNSRRIPQVRQKPKKPFHTQVCCSTEFTQDHLVHDVGTGPGVPSGDVVQPVLVVAYYTYILAIAIVFTCYFIPQHVTVRAQFDNQQSKKMPDELQWS